MSELALRGGAPLRTKAWPEWPQFDEREQRELTRALARHPGHVKTRQQLMHEGYPYDAYVSDRTIDSHIKRLRKKFELVDDAYAAIETVHGLGYRYAAG